MKTMLTKIAGYEVDSKLLEAYLNVAVEHHFAEAGPSLLISRRMMLLHQQLRESVGLDGFWTNPPDKFDEALSRMWYEMAQKDKRTVERRRLLHAERKEVLP